MSSKRPAVRIQDVARAAGVSVTTASRVLNNKADVAPETYERVRRVMQEMNYTASLAAKSMRSQTANVIGLLLPDLTDVYMQEIIRGVGEAIKDSGYDLMIYTRGRQPGASWEQEHVALLSNGLTDGCIVVTPSAPRFPETARIVVIDPQGDGAHVPSVVARNRAGALEAMAYLISLGHRRIGFIAGRPDTLSAMRRFKGYQDALQAEGIAFDPTLVEEGHYSRELGRDAALRLLNRPDRPTAIFAANDRSAMGAIEAAHDLGLRVPEDLSVIGFDNVPEAAQISPKLTTVDQSIQDTGRLATQLLIRILRGDEPEQKLLKVPTRLIIRESCQPPAERLAAVPAVASRSVS